MVFIKVSECRQTTRTQGIIADDIRRERYMNEPNAPPGTFNLVRLAEIPFRP